MKTTKPLEGRERTKSIRAIACFIPGVLMVMLVCATQSGCTTWSLSKAANDARLPHAIVDTGRFEHAVVRQSGPGAAQVVFIEGDGQPWNRRGNQPSVDPTPRVALAWQLMRQTPADALYIGRPCYFGPQGPDCTPDIWTHRRFSPDVVASMQDVIKLSVDEQRPIVLVGYSGGGALAQLLAARLPNVVGVVTVAGLIDTDAWTDYHGYEPLAGSLNPRAARLSPGVVQIHLLGEQDRNVPARHTRSAVGDGENVHLLSYERFDHRCCWEQHWPKAWQQINRLIAGFSAPGSDSSAISDPESRSAWFHVQRDGSFAIPVDEPPLRYPRSYPLR